jgi:hypothetical protein
VQRTSNISGEEAISISASNSVVPTVQNTVVPPTSAIQIQAGQLEPTLCFGQ